MYKIENIYNKLLKTHFGGLIAFFINEVNTAFPHLPHSPKRSYEKFFVVTAVYGHLHDFDELFRDGTEPRPGYKYFLRDGLGS